MDKEKEIKTTNRELEEEIIELFNEMSTKPDSKKTKHGCNLIHGNACVLGTFADDEPRTTPVDFFNDGMTIWIAGEPGGKIANIMKNPKVAIGIYVPLDHYSEQKSIQAWGKATLINIKNNPEEFKKRMESFGINGEINFVVEKFIQWGKIPKDQRNIALQKYYSRLNLIKIVLEKVILLNFRPDKPPLKKIWENGKATVIEAFLI
jgi:hypothetical protein